jgi:hypothetical protein
MYKAIAELLSLSASCSPCLPYHLISLSAQSVTISFLDKTETLKMPSVVSKFFDSPGAQVSGSLFSKG